MNPNEAFKKKHQSDQKVRLKEALNTLAGGIESDVIDNFVAECSQEKAQRMLSELEPIVRSLPENLRKLDEILQET